MFKIVSICYAQNFTEYKTKKGSDLDDIDVIDITPAVVHVTAVASVTAISFTQRGRAFNRIAI